MTTMTDDDTTKPAPAAPDDSPAGAGTVDSDASPTSEPAKGPEQKPGEIGGPQGPEPTRYGDWEFKGRCTDF
ncbi:succinate dehydrogenase assembly factor 4 [Azospirillum oleiclasticum]